MWIGKDSLEIDPTYQREINENKAKQIAARFSWRAFGVLLVGRRKDRLFVFDGATRLTGARKRDEIKSVPCIIFPTEEIYAEAQGFLDANTLRKPVTAIQKFRAQIVVGDPFAVKLDAMIRGAGFSIVDYAKGPRHVTCVRALTAMLRENEPVLTRVWELLVEMGQHDHILEVVAHGLFFIESRIDSRGLSLLRQPWRDRVLSLGMRGLMEAAQRAAAFHAKGGPKVWADGILVALNRKTRNRLTFDGIVASSATSD